MPDSCMMSLRRSPDPSARRRVGCSLPRLALIFELLGIVAAHSGAQTPIHWTGPDGNGHFYEHDKCIGQTWYELNAAARGRSFLGMPGHLVTVNTPAEQQFLLDKVHRRYTQTWYGAYQDRSAPDYAEPGGGWRWVTGEPWLYTNWDSGEPNNRNNGPGFEQEDGLVYNDSARVTGWMDAPRTYRYEHAGFIIEYEPIPEPGTLTLLLAPCLGALGFSTRRGRVRRPRPAA